MKEVKDNLEMLIDNITLVSNLFYKQMDTEGFNNLAIVLNEIESIMDQLNILTMEKDNNFYGDNEINNTLRNAIEALEGRDYILLADILNYDLVPLFKNILNNI